MTDHVDISYLAHLARLKLSEEEKAEFNPQLDRILHFVEKLGELDVDGIEPTSHAVPVHNILRDDDVRSCLPREAILKNAPATVQDLIRMPKIVE